MKLPLWTRYLDPVGWLLLFLAAITVIAAFWWFVFAKPARDRNAAASARAGQIIAQGQAKASGDAIVILDRTKAAAEASETLTRENADAIRNAPGADVALDPGLNRIGRERLCQRAAYAGSAECVQLADRTKPKG